MKSARIVTSICLLVILIGCKSTTILSVDDKVPAAYLFADFKEITSCIEQKVPNPYYLCGQSSYDSLKQKITTSLDRPMTTLEFYQTVSPLFALMRDAHFQFFIEDRLIKNLERHNPDLYFPFTVFIDSNRIFVDKCLRAPTPLKRGDEILSINNVPSKQILNKLRHGFSLKSNEENLFERMNEDHFYRGLLLEMNFRNNFSLKFADKTLKVKGVSIKTIRSADDTASDFTYKILNEKTKIGYLSINTLLSDKRQKLDSVLTIFFKTLKQQQVNKLIIDIRNNYGGSTKLSRDIFDYITDKKYLIDIGEEYLSGSKRVFDSDTVLSIPRQIPDKFTGTTILLTNVTSYSSAHMMANSFKYYKMGVVVGQISAEPLYISGEVREIITTNTKSSAYLPASNFYLPGYQKKNISYFVPDYQVYPTIDDRINGKDAVLNLAIKMLGAH